MKGDGTRRGARIVPLVAMGVAASDDPWLAPLGVVAYIVLALAAGLYMDGALRGATVRGAAAGALAYAVVRLVSMVVLGGPAGLDLPGALAPALVSLAAFLAALATGLWWRVIWRRSPTADTPA